jgi:hypothetical protein
MQDLPEGTMTTVDQLLEQMRDAPPHAGLSAIGAGVVEGAMRLREQRVSRRGLALAGAIALVIGAGGSLVPTAPASASPLFGIPASAPSHLLAD